MLSRRALDDLDTFLASGSGARRSNELTSDAVDVSDDTFDTVETGDVRLDEKVEDGFRVFERGSTSFGFDFLISLGDGSTNALLNEGLGLDFDDHADMLLLPLLTPIFEGIPFPSPFFKVVLGFVFWGFSKPMLGRPLAFGRGGAFWNKLTGLCELGGFIDEDGAGVRGAEGARMEEENRAFDPSVARWRDGGLA